MADEEMQLMTDSALSFWHERDEAIRLLVDCADMGERLGYSADMVWRFLNRIGVNPDNVRRNLRTGRPGVV